VGVTDWVGRSVPFSRAANGKCFLAFGVGEVEERELIRRRGYATSIDELEVGLSALAAPVLGSDGVVVAALSISGPTSRLTSERMEQLAPLLSSEAASLSQRLRGAA
jgi:DNA-binding IclR family transcriptional regulator